MRLKMHNILLGHEVVDDFFKHIYHIFRPIAHALSIQKRSEIVKNEHARYTL
jgi:hypothetical protein